MKRPGLVIILAAAALLLATACGGEDTTPTPTTSLPTSTPTQEAMDDEMSGDTGSGDMGMMAPSGDLVLALHELNDSGQSGIAVLTANGNQTNVTIIATASISELNHIHSGDCMNIGGVEYPLTNMADGMSITILDTSLETLQAGGLAVNLHMAGDPATYTACADIPQAEMGGGDTGASPPATTPNPGQGEGDY